MYECIGSIKIEVLPLIFGQLYFFLAHRPSTEQTERTSACWTRPSSRFVRSARATSVTWRPSRSRLPFRSTRLEQLTWSSNQTFELQGSHRKKTGIACVNNSGLLCVKCFCMPCTVFGYSCTCNNCNNGCLSLVLWDGGTCKTTAFRSLLSLISQLFMYQL